MGHLKDFIALGMGYNGRRFALNYWQHKYEAVMWGFMGHWDLWADNFIVDNGDFFLPEGGREEDEKGSFLLVPIRVFNHRITMSSAQNQGTS